MMYRCKGKNCDIIIEGKDRWEHLQQSHPKMYALIMDATRKGLRKAGIPKGMFKKLDSVPIIKVNKKLKA